MSEKKRVHAVLLHLTHYDPAWMEKKEEEEKRFDRALMEELIDLAAENGYDVAVIDVADAVEYASHPDLRRPYTVPMSELSELSDRARERGMEVVGKLNFAKADRHRHNWWFRPYRDLPDDDEYFRHAWEVIDEVLEAVGPGGFFHVGMDEDFERTPEGYCRVVERFREGLARRGRRTIIWSDICVQWDESLAEARTFAAQRLPRDIVMNLWHYRQAWPDKLEYLVDLGYEVWAATGRADTGVAAQWRQAVEEHGGAGLMTTVWMPVQPEHADLWRKVIVESAEGFGIRR